MGGAAVDSCPRCGAPLRRVARFCGRCGLGRPGVLAEGHDRLQGRFSAERSADRRAAASVAVGFCATLGALVLAEALAARAGLAVDARYVLLHAGLLFAAGAAAVLVQGHGAWRASLAGLSAPRWLLLSPLVGAAVFALAWLFVEAMLRAFPLEQPDLLQRTAPTFALIVVVAPLLEEWLDRGVLWTACERAGGPAVALVATSGLFAVSHGLGGGAYFEFPHRFLGGLALGWLRWRSGSLLPPILAHATWNALAFAELS